MKRFFRNCLILAVILLVSGVILVVISSTWGEPLTWRKAWDSVADRFHINSDIPLEKAESALSAGQNVLDSVQSALAKDAEIADPISLEPSSSFHDAYEVYEGDFDKQAISDGQVTNLRLEIGNCELYIEKSEDNSCYLEVDEGDKVQFYQEGETLYVKTLDSRVFEKKWWDFNSWDAKVYLWLPDGVTYQDTYIEVGAGTVEIDELSAQNMTIKAGAGTVKADRLTADKLYFEIGAGAVKAEYIQAEYLDSKVGAGSAKIEQMVVKDLEAKADAGNFRAEGSLTGNAKLHCSVGNMELKLSGKTKDYNYTVSCAIGSVHIGSERYSGLDSKIQTIDNGSDKKMDINCSIGTVKIKF